jgi:hypothetical protein
MQGPEGSLKKKNQTRIQGRACSGDHASHLGPLVPLGLIRATPTRANEPKAAIMAADESGSGVGNAQNEPSGDGCEKR